jgi:hypothetical protein
MGGHEATDSATAPDRMDRAVPKVARAPEVVTFCYPALLVLS